MARLKEAIKFVCAVFYLIYMHLLGQKQRRVVLCYHGIKEQDIQGFEKQMKYLARKCVVVKPSAIKATQIDEANHIVVITFDDAFVNVMENAIPILRKYALAAGIFVATNNLGRKPHWDIPEDYSDKNETIMDENQIMEVEKNGFEIFSHTCSHPILTEMEDNSLETELVCSKNSLETIVGHEVLAISYPYGAYNPRVCQAAKKAGYKLGFTIEPNLVNSTTEPLEIGRFLISPNDSLIKFKLKVSGVYQIAKYLSRLKNLFVKA